MGGRRGQEAVLKLKRKCRDELGQVMGHPCLKTGLNKRKLTAQVFIQYHRAVQPHTAIPRLTTASLRPHTAHEDHHWVSQKQPTKTDHSSLADFDCEI